MIRLQKPAVREGNVPLSALASDTRKSPAAKRGAHFGNCFGTTSERSPSVSGLLPYVAAVALTTTFVNGY